MKYLLTITLFCALLSGTTLSGNVVYAQDANSSSEDVVASTKNDLMVVGAAGVGGAVLGLSTLSFVDEPSKKLSNIWMGASLGIIAGVIIVAVGYAQKAQEDLTQGAFLGPAPRHHSQYFAGAERLAWAIHESQKQRASFERETISSPLWSLRF